MRYVSTRGEAPSLDFENVLLTGLARDGGLYVPETWPQFPADEISSWRDLSYGELALKVMRPLVGDGISEADLSAIIEGAYSQFDTDEVAPLRRLGDNEWLLELFHGPTLAFKDMALQFLGRAFDHVLGKRGERVTIVGATSGDTGSAAIEACRDRDAIEVFILYPEGRVSDVQRRQMTTVTSENVHCIALKGTFDDCQDMVKAMFNDSHFRDRLSLSAVNSINWARIMAQIVYYFWAALKLGAPERAVAFSVPTGNFGNVYAGYAAKRMGLPVEQLIVGSNSNDILTRFFESGRMELTCVHPTISPSMDIQISSNFERLLFELYDRDPARVAAAMTAFRTEGKFEVKAEELAEARRLFDGARFSDDETRDAIRTLEQETGQLIDPHSAVGIAAGRAKRRNGETPLAALATAHPAKFPDAVEQASGLKPQLPDRLSDLFERSERFDVLENDLETVKAFVADRAAGRLKDGAAA